MVTGYEADFYRQFGELTKNSHQIVNQLKQNNQCLNDMLKLIAGNLVNLRKQLEENNVSRDLNDQSETTLVEAIQNLTDMVSDSCQTVEYTQILDRIATALEKGRLR